MTAPTHQNLAAGIVTQLRNTMAELTTTRARLAAVTAERDQALAEVKEDDGVRRLLHRRLADAEARLAAAPHDSSCLIDWAGEGDNVHHYPNAGTCDCWKAAL